MKIDKNEPKIDIDLSAKIPEIKPPEVKVEAELGINVPKIEINPPIPIPQTQKETINFVADKI